MEIDHGLPSGFVPFTRDHSKDIRADDGARDQNGPADGRAFDAHTCGASAIKLDGQNPEDTHQQSATPIMKARSEKRKRAVSAEQVNAIDEAGQKTSAHNHGPNGKASIGGSSAQLCSGL